MTNPTDPDNIAERAEFVRGLIRERIGDPLPEIDFDNPEMVLVAAYIVGALGPPETEPEPGSIDEAYREMQQRRRELALEWPPRDGDMIDFYRRWERAGREFAEAVKEMGAKDDGPN